MLKLVCLVPLLPLIGFLVIGLFGKKLSKGWVSAIGCGSVFASFAISLAIFIELIGRVEKSWLDCSGGCCGLLKKSPPARP